MILARRLFLAASAVAVLAGCATSSGPGRSPGGGGQPAFGTFGFDTTGMDRSTAPGDDFYDFANGAWTDRTEIPADRSSFNSFTRITEQAEKRVADIIRQTAQSRPAAGTDARKIADYYAAFTDEAAIESRGLAPLQPELQAIAGISDRRQLAAVLGSTLRADVDALNSTDYYTDRIMGAWVAEDLNRPDRYTVYLMQGGLGLPDREYYLGDSERFRDIRGQYETHIAAMLRLAGVDDAAARAKRVVALETALARTHATAVDTSDVLKANNPWRRADFASKAPGLDWDAFFNAAGLGGRQDFIVWQPGGISGAARLAGSESLDAWKDYLSFRAIERAAPYLPQAFVQEHFKFNGQALSGTPQLRARDRRAIDEVNGALGEAVGRLYVQRWFPAERKAQLEEMVRNLKTAFDRRITALDWMSLQTKQTARRKLAEMRVGIGYPETWKDYSGLEVRPGDALGNAQRASQFAYRQELAKLGGPVDRNAWHLLPHEVNALNAPLQNSIIFPAAILEPTFFDAAADPAVNYGAIGGVIGHEIVHGFDDIGAMFDPEGRLRNWWTDADLARFRASGKALAEQYDTYCPFPDACVNGELTLSENTADVAGLAAAYDAYHLSLNGRPGPVLDGYTGDQRVFLGWAQNYRSRYREPALRRYVLTNVHSPGMYRAQIVRNLDAWYAAFNVQPGQKLYLPPEKRVEIW